MTHREPDVEIAAAIRADEVRFECKPESVTERENLPDELEPGVTYRNFAVRWRAAARLEDPDSRGRRGDTPSGSPEREASSRAGRLSKRKSSRSLGRDEIRTDDPRTWSGRRASREEL